MSCLRQREARHNVHGLQLLEEQLAGVRQLHRLHVVAGFGGRADGAPHIGIKVTQQPAMRAHMHLPQAFLLSIPAS